MSFLYVPLKNHLKRLFGLGILHEISYVHTCSIYVPMIFHVWYFIYIYIHNIIYIYIYIYIPCIFHRCSMKSHEIPYFWVKNPPHGSQDARSQAAKLPKPWPWPSPCSPRGGEVTDARRIRCVYRHGDSVWFIYWCLMDLTGFWKLIYTDLTGFDTLITGLAECDNWSYWILIMDPTGFWWGLI